MVLVFSDCVTAVFAIAIVVGIVAASAGLYIVMLLPLVVF